MLSSYLRSYSLDLPENGRDPWARSIKDVHGGRIDNHRVHATVYILRDRICGYTRCRQPYIDLVLVNLRYVYGMCCSRYTLVLKFTLFVSPQCLSPQMIILRVLMGRGWTKDAMTTVTTARFKNPDTCDTHVTTTHSQVVYGSSGTEGTAINLSALSTSHLSKSRDSGMEI